MQNPVMPPPHGKEIVPNRILGFVKMRGQKYLKSMKKGVNWIVNQGRIDTKCLKSVK